MGGIDTKKRLMVFKRKTGVAAKEVLQGALTLLTKSKSLGAATKRPSDSGADDDTAEELLTSIATTRGSLCSNCCGKSVGLGTSKSGEQFETSCEGCAGD